MFARRQPDYIPQVRRGFARPRRHRRPLAAILAGLLALIAGGAAVLIFWPGAAAQNIDHLRDIIGDRPVAQLEEAVLGIQDRAQQLAYQAGLVKPAAPWTETPPTEAATRPTPAAALIATQVVAAALPSPAAAAAATTPPPAWRPGSLLPMGRMQGEGIWSPYLTAGSDGRAVAYRTFFQPDPRRPYSVVAVVAFDLRAARLHFVLGSVEPIPAEKQAGRTGKIPAGDMRAGVLLATFNGGFKARHGHFGAMSGGITALPPIDDLATVAIYADGTVRMGKWNTDIDQAPGLVAWRQNSKLLVRYGQVNPATTNLNELWGVTVDYKTVTWRSALGLSADGQTLYYAAGPAVDVATMAAVMEHVDADEAMELDVNPYWVNFAAIHGDGSGLAAEALLPGMSRDVDRYLKASARDFFYVTAGGGN